jgi:hypothetical protein
LIEAWFFLVKLMDSILSESSGNSQLAERLAERRDRAGTARCTSIDWMLFSNLIFTVDPIFTDKIANEETMNRLFRQEIRRSMPAWRRRRQQTRARTNKQ